MFTRIVASPAPPGLVLHQAAELMVKLLSEPAKLREEVTSLITRQREELRLPRLTMPTL